MQQHAQSFRMKPESNSKKSTYPKTLFIKSVEWEKFTIFSESKHLEITRLLLKLLVSVVPKQPQCVNEYDCSNKTLFTQWVCWPTGHVRWQAFI